MLAKGCFAVCAPHPLDAGRFSGSAIVERMRSFCEADEVVHAQLSPDGRCIVGSIAGNGQERWITVRSDAERGSAGAFDGWTYTDSTLRDHPERLGELEEELRTHANGMFTAVGYTRRADAHPGSGPGSGARQRAEVEPMATLSFLTDPFSTTPLYYGERDGLFVCATSLPLVAELLDLREQDSGAMAELLCFTEILTDATPVAGIRRAEPATRYTWSPGDGTLASRRYWTPEIGVDGPENDEAVRRKNTHAIGLAADRFAEAVRRTAAVAPAPLHAALTGGLDSRTLWAVLLNEGIDAKAVVHASADPDKEGQGNDLRIARTIAKKYRITLREALLGEEFLQDAPADLPRFFCASNGLCSGDLLHLPYLYRRHAVYTSAIIDGVNSFSERRHGMRRAAAQARTREALADAVWNVYFNPGLVNLLPSPERKSTMETAHSRLRTLILDPKDYASPAAAAESLYLTRLIGRHGNDAAAVQNHNVRFMTPYFDLDYVEALLRVPEPLRSAERLQDEILRRNAPALRSVSRSYAEVRTLPVAWRPLQLLPVALQHYAIARLPRPLRRRLDLRRGGSRHAEWFRGPLAPLFDGVRHLPAPFDPSKVEDFLMRMAAGEQVDTHTAGFLLGQLSASAGAANNFLPRDPASLS
ncbi:MAG: hypothetical protein IH600_16635 [Bacteroidetes bacterium]|nr:hypothetical protein [Bacteroidota bacterium]